MICPVLPPPCSGVSDHILSLSSVLDLLPGGCDVMCRENGVRTPRTRQTGIIMINTPPPPSSVTTVSFRATALVLVSGQLIRTDLRACTTHVWKNKPLSRREAAPVTVAVTFQCQSRARSKVCRQRNAKHQRKYFLENIKILKYCTAVRCSPTSSWSPP